MLERFGDEILEVMEVKTNSQIAFVRTHYSSVVKLVLKGENSISINTPLPLEVEYRDWQGNLLPDETRPIYITIQDIGGLEEFTLIPINGKAEFDFMSEQAGVFRIKAQAKFPCDSAELEVTVNE